MLTWLNGKTVGRHVFRSFLCGCIRKSMGVDSGETGLPPPKKKVEDTNINVPKSLWLCIRYYDIMLYNNCLFHLSLRPGLYIKIGQSGTG